MAIDHPVEVVETRETHRFPEAKSSIYPNQIPSNITIQSHEITMINHHIYIHIDPMKSL